MIRFIIALLLTVSAADASPIVILASGQSNFVLAPAYPWSPNANVKVWNFNGTDGHIGAAYGPLSNTTINTTGKTASDIAAATGRPVCLVTVAFSGMSISHWLPGTVAPDIYQNVINNITLALAACGAPKIDLFDWWQGEGDATSAGLNTGYPANFESVITRLKGNSWFPPDTPILVHQICATALCGFTNFDAMNGLLSNVVQADSANRSWVRSTSLGSFNFWDSSNQGHMLGEGYFAEGAMASNIYLNGPGRMLGIAPHMQAGVEYPSALPLPSANSPFAIASLQLPSGTWKVSGEGGFAPVGATTQTYTTVSLSTSSDLDITQGRFVQQPTPSFSSAGVGTSLGIPEQIFMGPTTVNLILQSGFVGTMKGYGSIKADLVR